MLILMIIIYVPSFIDVAKQLKVHWNQLGQAAVEQRDVVQRIKKLVDMYDAVKKGKHRRTPTQLNYEKKFLHVLNLAFDIAPKVNYHKNKHQKLDQIENLNNIADNNNHHQNKHQDLGDVAPKDNNYYHQNKHQDLAQIQNLNCAEINHSVAMKLENTYCHSDDESNDIEMDQEENGNDVDFETTLSTYHKLQFSADVLDEENDDDIVYKIINSKDVASALDRTNTPTGSFVIILAAIARALDVDLTECVFSASTLLRRRTAHRECIKAEVKTEFLASIKSGLVVHFDGKRLKDTTNDEKDERNGKVDRIAIVVTGFNIQKILAIAKTDDGSGVVVSDIVHEHLEAWSILDSIVAMCTDTTGANTGVNQGACVRLERKMKRNLIYLACRHHVLELIIGAIFVMLFGETTGPYTEMFENFKRDWSQIDKASFKVS